jgi:peptidoglycan/LPS O-acetylase OafA/YrhL
MRQMTGPTTAERVPPEPAEDLASAVRTHMPVMDGWRGLAILVVVIHNAGAALDGTGTLAISLATTTLRSGWVGVQLFFVLSGFLISGILLDSAGAPRYFRDFYIRRTLRIFPLYYGFLVVVLVLAPLLAGPGAWTESVHSDGIWYWLYLSNWTPLMDSGIVGLSHIWSLAAEEQFYLVWPLLILVSGRRFPAVALGVVLMAMASRAALYSTDPKFLYTFTITRADAFAIGALLSLAARRPSWTKIFMRHGRTMLLAVSIGLMAVIGVSRGFGQYQPAVLLAGQTVIALWFAILMFMTLAPRGKERQLSDLLESGWLRSLGKYSYAIYVVHYPMHALVRDRVMPVINRDSQLESIALTAAYAILILAASYAMAIASWHVYEKHFLALKNRWAPRTARPT